jgi:hypothetical protein
MIYFNWRNPVTGEEGAIMAPHEVRCPGTGKLQATAVATGSGLEFVLYDREERPYSAIHYDRDGSSVVRPVGR